MNTDLEYSLPGLMRAKSSSNVDSSARLATPEPVTQRILGQSQVILDLMARMDQVALTQSSVLILGETGTGKELVARAIHERSSRKRMPFVPVNCSALPENLMESELFGHKRGAFTGADENRRGLFEEAQGGTLFLDEIGEIPFRLQAKLLRVLQEKKVRPLGENSLRSVDVRVIAATHRNLRELVRLGEFREDLYYRLAVVTLYVPPLRNRREDIAFIASDAVRRLCEVHGLPLKYLRPQAIEHLEKLDWKGNVRELENTLERAVIFSSKAWVDGDDIESVYDREPKMALTPGPLSSLKEKFGDVFMGVQSLPSLRELEKAYIEFVLEQTNHAKEKAAKVLGIDRKTLYRKELGDTITG